MPARQPAIDLGDRIAATLARNSAEVAVEFEGKNYGWDFVAAIVRRVHALLDGAGLAEEMPVGLVLRNHPATYAAMLAVIASRRCAVLVSPFQSAESIAGDLGRLKPAAVVALTDDWTAPVLEAAKATGALGIAVTLDPDRPAHDVAERAASVATAPMPGVSVQMLTSGTTGVPKRIPLGRVGLSLAIEDQIRMAAAMGEAPAGADAAATLVQYAPIVQLSGIYNALQAAAEGRRLVMMGKFEASAWVASVRTHRQRMLALPPAMMRMVLEAAPPREDLASLRSVRSGAAPLDADTRTRFEEVYGVPVLSIYGATEFVGPIASWSLDDYARFNAAKRGSVGRIWPDIAEVRVVDPDSGRHLAPGERGLLEVLVSRAGPDWIRTNDLATVDADGFLFIHGRADDAINRGGFKIPPDIIADALRTHPQVYDAAAIPLPDARLGQVPVAVVELRTGGDLPSEQDLVAYVRSRLIAYQVPVRIRIVPALPRTPAQKISRPGLLALFET